MIKQVVSSCIVILLVAVLSVFYFNFDGQTDIDKVFLSISTFLFSIFTGFFISRQAGRFNKVRETVTAFDGKMSGIYRSSGHVNRELQAYIGRVISEHYKKIFTTGKWNIHFLEKSTTLTDIHASLEQYIDEEKVTKLSNQSIGAVVKSLAAIQDLRKQMVALYEERIPQEQWVLIFFFAAMLLTTVSLFPSKDLFFLSILKASFVVSVISVLLILYKLNNLNYSENIMGEHSAKDVLGIIEGSK